MGPRMNWLVLMETLIAFSPLAPKSVDHDDHWLFQHRVIVPVFRQCRNIPSPARGKVSHQNSDAGTRAASGKAHPLDQVASGTAYLRRDGSRTYRSAIKREPGKNPGLPRSGNKERTSS